MMDKEATSPKSFSLDIRTCIYLSKDFISVALHIHSPPWLVLIHSSSVNLSSPSRINSSSLAALSLWNGTRPHSLGQDRENVMLQFQVNNREQGKKLWVIEVRYSWSRKQWKSGLKSKLAVFTPYVRQRSYVQYCSSLIPRPFYPSVERCKWQALGLEYIYIRITE